VQACSRAESRVAEVGRDGVLNRYGEEQVGLFAPGLNGFGSGDSNDECKWER
jgi:hypothetical protein